VITERWEKAPERFVPSVCNLKEWGIDSIRKEGSEEGPGENPSFHRVMLGRKRWGGGTGSLNPLIGGCDWGGGGGLKNKALHFSRTYASASNIDVRFQGSVGRMREKNKIIKNARCSASRAWGQFKPHIDPQLCTKEIRKWEEKRGKNEDTIPEIS